MSAFIRREVLKELGPVVVRTDSVLTFSSQSAALSWFDHSDEAVELRRLAAGGEITVEVRGDWLAMCWLDVQRG